MAAESCQPFALYRQIDFVITQAIVCVLLVLRVYTLYGRDSRILKTLVGGRLVLSGTAVCLALIGQKSFPSPHALGCLLGLSSATAIKLAAPWEALFLFDTIIYGLTLHKTWKKRRWPRDNETRIPLISLMLRDGTIYFAVMALVNLANILTFYLPGPYLRGGLSNFASNISVTMVSRLMLNLHQLASSEIRFL